MTSTSWMENQRAFDVCDRWGFVISAMSETDLREEADLRPKEADVWLSCSVCGLWVREC